jgi:hypothetical protein
MHIDSTLCAGNGPQAHIVHPGYCLLLSRADYRLIAHGDNEATAKVALLDCLRQSFSLQAEKRGSKESDEEMLNKLASCFAVQVFEPGKRAGCETRKKTDRHNS